MEVAAILPVRGARPITNLLCTLPSTYSVTLPYDLLEPCVPPWTLP